MTASEVRTLAHPDAAACAALEQVFAHSLGRRYRTELCGGYPEPLYTPAKEPGQLHRIAYRDLYFASALHELAHWCLAGRERRSREDYGYWYAPEGRSPEQQLAFEAVEYKPQALEWIFSQACGRPFKVSADNLDLETGAISDNRQFKMRVKRQAELWQRAGLPERAAELFSALQQSFGGSQSLAELRFSLVELD